MNAIRRHPTAALIAVAIAFVLVAGGASVYITGRDRELASTSPPSAQPIRPATEETVIIAAPEGVLGWWDGTSWVRWKSGANVPAVGGEPYRIVRLDSPTATKLGSAPDEGCNVTPRQPPGVGIGFDRSEEGRGIQIIAVGGTHELQPRRVESLSRSSDRYRELAGRVLSKLGVKDRRPALAQIVRTDVEGDGVDEVIVVVERISEPGTLFAEAGDYSVVFVRHVESGAVMTSVLSKSVADPMEGETPFVETFRTLAVSDLNGDGWMEIAIASMYYEGSGVTVHEVRDEGSPEEILSVGCGV